MPEFAPVLELSSLNGTNGFRLDGVAAFDNSGWSVASAGDVNGDGFDDLIVGAPRALRSYFYDWNGYSSYGSRGSSYVVFGKAGGFASSLNLSTLDGINGFRLDGVSDGDKSGVSVASAGDVNGDGFDDVIVGAPFVDVADRGAGASYVVFGKAGGSGYALWALDGSNGFRLDGEEAFDNIGESVASAGDVNGDGFDDLIIGAPNAGSYYGSYSGKSYVVFGKAGGFASSLNLWALDGSNGFRLGGDSDESGRSVASAGDVNGDGFDDLIVGAWGADPNGSGSGSSYVVFGKAGGFASSLHLWALDGTNGFRLDGVAASDLSGWSVASAGDVNGDGFDDLIVGAPSADPNGGYSGSSYVVFGKAGGFASSLNLSALDGTNGFRLDGVAASDHSGRSVASAGDVNGDGFDDLIVGANSSYVVFGKAGGFASSINLSTLNGNNGFRLDGGTSSVASAGDVNGDGFADLIVGAPSADPNTNSDSGSSYVIFGHRALTAVNRVGTDLDNRINGGVGDDTVSGLSGNDTLLGWEGNDTINGGDGNDVLVGGLGGDILHGGPDADGASYADASARVRADLASPGGNLGEAAGDSYIELENLTGSKHNDALFGNNAANALNGGLGGDLLAGRGGNDWLNGGAGNDVLIGGSRTDRLTGGAGADRFDFNAITHSGPAKAARDTVTDFQQGLDLFDLATIDANTGLGGNQAFVLTGNGGQDPFTAPGQVRFFKAGGNTIVQLSNDADLSPDGAFTLTGLFTLTGGDFLL